MSKKIIKNNQPESAMDIRQFRAYLGISDNLARKMLKEPGFPAVMIHGRYRIFPGELRVWLKKNYAVKLQQEEDKEKTA